MTEEQILSITGLIIGQKVIHANEGQGAGGNYGRINLGVGEVLSVKYEGPNEWKDGGCTFSVKVKWSNGETFNVGLQLIRESV